MNALAAFSLDGKVALVTGGSRGLGRAMAQALGEAGAAVAVTSRTLDSARAAAAELADLGIRSFGVRLEVTDPDDVERAVETVSAQFGPIDVLVNNAGVGTSGAAFDLPESEWRGVLATNVDGVWHCSRAVGQRMRARGGGVIVNVGSMSADIVNRPRWQAPYLASKAAVHQLTKARASRRSWSPMRTATCPARPL